MLRSSIDETECAGQSTRNQLRRAWTAFTLLLVLGACATDDHQPSAGATPQRMEVDSRALEPMTMNFRGRIFPFGMPSLVNPTIELQVSPRTMAMGLVVEHHPRTGSIAAQTTADGSGAFSIPIWRDVAVTYRGFLSLRCDVAERAKIVIPVPDWREDRVPVDIDVEKSSNLHARITDPLGKAISEARVYLLSDRPTWLTNSNRPSLNCDFIESFPKVIAESTTDENGDFQIYEYAIATVDRLNDRKILLIEADGYQSQSIELGSHLARTFTYVPPEIVLKPTPLDLRLNVLAASDSRPIVGWIEARRQGPGFYTEPNFSVGAITGSNGIVVLPSGPAWLDEAKVSLETSGDLRVSVSPFPPYLAPFMVWTAWAGTSDELQLHQVAGSNDFRVKESLESYSLIVVDDASGQPVERVWIRRTDHHQPRTDTSFSSSSSYGMELDADFMNRFTVRNGFGVMWPPPNAFVHNGTISLTINPKFKLRVDAFGFLPSVIEPAKESRSEPIVVRLKRGATIRSRVVDSAGSPVGGATVVMLTKLTSNWVPSFIDELYDPSRKYSAKLVWTAADGTFTLSQVPEGREYTIIATGQHMRIPPRPGGLRTLPGEVVDRTVWRFPKDRLASQGPFTVAQTDESGNVIQIGDLKLPPS